MGRFRKILYLERRVRGSARAYAFALERAAEHGASLTLAGVVRAGERSGSARYWRGRLERMAEAGRVHGVPVHLRVLESGDNGAGPLELVAGHDLVITVGKAGASGWPFRLGDLERTLVRDCECPTWILDPVQSPDIRVVLAAVDVSAPDQESANRRILGTAAALAAGPDAELYVVHCWSVMGESLLASRTRGGSPKDAERVLDTAVEARRRVLERLLESMELGESTTVIFRKGKVVSCIRDTAWRTEADVVVVGTAARTGISALLVGNTAERLVGRVPGSVFVVRVPAGAGADGGGERAVDGAANVVGRDGARGARNTEAGAGRRRAAPGRRSGARSWLRKLGRAGRPRAW